MNLEFDILVIGGGIVGLTAALAMAQRNYKVAIIDAGSLTMDTSREDTRVYAINDASQMLLQQLHVWQHLDRARLSPYRRMFVWDATNQAHIDFDSRMIAAPSLGTIIEESILKQALLQQVSLQSSIYLFPENYVEEIFHENDGLRVSSNKGIWKSQLLMIADGANSPMRQKLKVALNSWAYDQHALVATITVEKEHQQTAYQVFHPNGPLAFLPLANPHQCSIVWSTDPIHATQLMELSNQEFNESLSQASGKKLGQTEVISARYRFPLQMRHTKQYIGNRWLLLGDAAHTIHPLAGLGLNLGLADVRSWICCLDASNHALSSKIALRAYQRERKNAVWQIIMLMEGFKRFFSNSYSPVIALRGLGLNLCNGFMPIKRLFIRHAQGLE